MSGNINARLDELGLTLPTPFISNANYIPFVLSRDLLFIAGQGPFSDGAPASIGKVGGAVDEKAAYEAARLTGLNLIAQANHACDGNLDRVVRCIRLFGLVNSVPSFTELPHTRHQLLIEVGRHWMVWKL